MPTIHVAAQLEDFNIADYIALAGKDPASGAIASFTGIVRDTDGKLESLLLEHFPVMTEKELTRIVQQACDRWTLNSCSVIHRYGTLKPGDNIVMVVTSSAHRQASFDAANFIMDFLKTDAPFWKKEIHKDSAHWVDARLSDSEAKSKWR